MTTPDKMNLEGGRLAHAIALKENLEWAMNEAAGLMRDETLITATIPLGIVYNEDPIIARLLELDSTVDKLISQIIQLRVSKGRQDSGEPIGPDVADDLDW